MPVKDNYISTDLNQKNALSHSPNPLSKTHSHLANANDTSRKSISEDAIRVQLNAVHKTATTRLVSYPKKKTYHFSGVGGSGMSAIAQVLRFHGHTVQGSDRNFDQHKYPQLFNQLETQGIQLFPQTGSGVDETVDEVVVSTAIETDNPDVQQAGRLGIPIVKRAEVLARLFNDKTGFAVGGTSGKSTVTAMIGHILTFCGESPTIINGGAMVNFISPPLLGNAVCGRSNYYVIEADESDGTIDYYTPQFAVVNNVSKDHKSLDELYTLFNRFLRKTQTASIVNVDCAKVLKPDYVTDRMTTFGLAQSHADIVGHSMSLTPKGVQFKVDNVQFSLKLLGQHNLMNALAAVATCTTAGVSLSTCSAALSEFLGVTRRLQTVGDAHGITVVDDFAHNPDKIMATLSTLKACAKRLLVMFQPHGFAPTRFTRDELICVFADVLDTNDMLIMPDIYYAGGTAEKTISSLDLIEPLLVAGINAKHIPQRSEIARTLVEAASPGDYIVIMGARDDSLSELAGKILAQLYSKNVQ